MNIVRYNSVWDDFKPAAFGQLVDRFFNDSIGHLGGTAYAFVPKVDIIERERGFEIQLSVPGMRKEDFQIEVKENRLTIAGERKLSVEDKAFVHRETGYGAFRRQFWLPEDVNGEGIEARYEQGLLVLVVPRNEKKTKTTIQVS